MTIHDLAFLKNENWFSTSFRKGYRFLIPRLCRRSRAVVTVSNFIRQELINEYSVSKEKIHVVPNGLPQMQFDEERPFDFKYFFMTGFYNPRKNAAFIMEQFPEIAQRGYHIVAVGGRASIYAATNTATKEALHVLDYVNDRQYYTLMKHAYALLYPSTYEGFGIPVLEALALDTKVIVPDIPVYRESFGNCPMYYQTDDPESFLQAMDNIVQYRPPEGELNFIKKKFTFAEAVVIFRKILD